MAHPYAEHRQHKVEKSRVSKIARGYATGGAVDAEAGQQSLMKGAKPKGAKLGNIVGKKATARMDKRARGGRVKGKGTNVNIVIASPQPQQGMEKPVPVPVPVPAGGPPPGAPPMPPPGAMAGGPPGMPPGAMPPGMPPIPRKRGGRVADVTGKVNNLKQSGPKNISPESPGAKTTGPGWKSSMAAKTKVAGMPGKQPDPPRGKPITFNTGGAALSDMMKRGRVVHSDGKTLKQGDQSGPPVSAKRATGGAAPGVKGTMRGGPKMKYGAESGMGRLERASKQKRA